MSREAAEDGKPDVAEEIVPAAMASASVETGEAWVTDGASEADDPGEATLRDEHDEGDLAAAGHDEDEDEDEDDEDVPDSLIEMAEPVELGEPGPVLPRPRRWPRLLLALGFVLLAAAIVAGAIAIVGSVTHGFKKPVKVTYKKSAVFSLKTGECFDPQGQSYSLIPCDSPHDAEVFATFNLTGTTWPGSPAVAAAANGGCASRLTGYLNPQLAVSLASTYIYPDATAWQAGTRTVICEVRAASGQLTGSVRGASATAG
jgi:Septum formation